MSSLKTLVRASHWKKSSRKKSAAIGMGCAITNAGATPVSVAMIRMQSDGVANIAAPTVFSMVFAAALSTFNHWQLAGAPFLLASALMLLALALGLKATDSRVARTGGTT